MSKPKWSRLIWIVGALILTACGSTDEYTGPCSHVAPEDRADCLNSPDIDFDPALKYPDLQNELLDEPVDPYDSSSGRSACPEGCAEHRAGCDIKGNISFDSGEKIYHLPGQEFYAATTINPDFGERWFCTESEAIDSGWRRSFK